MGFFHQDWICWHCKNCKCHCVLWFFSLYDCGHCKFLWCFNIFLL